MRYHFVVQARRVVEDTLTLSVDAESLGKAKKIATSVALSYPKGSKDVKHCYVENRDTLGSELVSIERVVPNDD